MKFLFFSIFSILLSTNVICQVYFFEEFGIEVEVNGRKLSDPFTGGFNSVQYSELDLNLDGINDLVVYDRLKGLVRPYINRGIQDSISYYYAAEFAERFPLMRDFLLTADFNNDGKFDLIIGRDRLELYENISNSNIGLGFEFKGNIESFYSATSSLPTIINPTGTNIPAIYDIDGDKDIDFLTNNLSRTIDYHRNLSKDLNNNYFSKIERRSTCWGSFFESFNVSRSRSDSVFLDSCLNGKIRGERKKRGEKHGSGLTISPLDYDDNSSMDILISDDGSYKMKMLLNADSVSFPYKTNSSIYKVLDSFPKYDVPVHLLFAAAYFIDLNNDGKKDMLVASNQANSSELAPFSKEETWLYENISNNNKYKFQLKTKDFLKNEMLDFGRTSKPCLFDYNNDGLIDMLIGNGGYLAKNDSSKFIPQLALLRNNGTKTQPKFELVDRDYLKISTLDLGVNYELFASVSVTAGDIDGDGDEDLLLTQENANIYLFEDTSLVGNEAEFKFHPINFQNLKTKGMEPLSSFLYDIDGNGILDLIVNSGVNIEYFQNFGTKTDPIFNIPLDSLYWIGGDTIRYHFGKRPNFNHFKLNDSLAVNNGQNVNNTSRTLLRLVTIDSLNNYIECINTIDQGVGSNKYDESNTDAHINFFNRSWRFYTLTNQFSVESVFMFKDKGRNQIVTGNPRGINSIVTDFTNKLEPIDSIKGRQENFIINYGLNTFINGADLNGDSIMDLVLGTNAGGLKILFGSRTNSLADIKDGNRIKQNNLFNLYPNPTKSDFVVSLNHEGIHNGNVEIRTLSGQLVKESILINKITRFSTSNLSSGIYFIRVLQNDKIETAKLVVQ